MTDVKTNFGHQPHPELDKRSYRHAFDRAAATYDAAAVLQKEVANRLLERLDYVKLKPQLVLDVGSGTGFCAAALAQRYKKARIIALDIAPAMLQQARNKISRLEKLFNSRQRFICADADFLPVKDNSVDLVVSNLTLQWCPNLEQTFAEIRRVLKPNGLFMFSTLGPDTLKELRYSWLSVDADVHVHTFLDMHDVGDALLRAQFADPVMDMETITLTYKEARLLMRDLKALGAHNASAARSKGLTGRRRLQAMLSAYEKYRNDGVLPATYEVVYGQAWTTEVTRSKPPRSTSQQVVSFPHKA